MEKQLSQTAIKNINVVIKGAKLILGNQNIFTSDQLASFVVDSLGILNEVPPFTKYTLEDTNYMQVYGQDLSKYTVLLALVSIYMIEKGKEFLGSNNELFTPAVFVSPNKSEILETKYANKLNEWLEETAKTKAQYIE